MPCMAYTRIPNIPLLCRLKRAGPFHELWPRTNLSGKAHQSQSWSIMRHGGPPRHGLRRRRGRLLDHTAHLAGEAVQALQRGLKRVGRRGRPGRHTVVKGSAPRRRRRPGQRRGARARGARGVGAATADGCPGGAGPAPVHAPVRGRENGVHRAGSTAGRRGVVVSRRSASFVAQQGLRGM